MTVAMIVRNEERVLARCLESLDGIYDELVIVDTGSEDETPSIAASYGARLVHYDGANGADGRIEDFSKARNVALDLATCDWVLQIDADEVLLSGREEICMIAKEAPADAIAICMRSEGAEWHSIRLFRRRAAGRYVSKIHEYVEISGEMLMKSDIVIENLPDKTGKESSYERNVRIAMGQVDAGLGTSRTWHFLGSEHYKAGEYDRARDCYGKALDLGGFPSGRFHSSLYKAACHLVLGDVEGAISEARRGIALGPDFPEAHCLLGDCYFLLDRFEEARSSFLNAIDCNSRRPASPFPSQPWMHDAHPRKQIGLIDRMLAEET